MLVVARVSAWSVVCSARGLPRRGRPPLPASPDGPSPAARCHATFTSSRAISSAGRAPPRQGGGHWFEPSIAHFWFAGHSPVCAVGAIQRKRLLRGRRDQRRDGTCASFVLGSQRTRSRG